LGLLCEPSVRGRTHPGQPLRQQGMAPLAAKIDPEVKQAGGRAYCHTEQASNKEDHDSHKPLHTEGKRQTSSPKQRNRHAL